MLHPLLDNLGVIENQFFLHALEKIRQFDTYITLLAYLTSFLEHCTSCVLCYMKVCRYKSFKILCGKQHNYCFLDIDAYPSTIFRLPNMANCVSLRNFLVPVMVLSILCCSALVNASISETRQVSGYTGVESAGPFIVSVDQNGSEGLRIEADLDDHNVTDSIEIFVDKQALKIRFMWPYSEDDGRFAGLIRIFVSAKSVNSFVSSGAGSMTVNQPVTASSINVVNSGSGPVVLTVQQASDLNAALSGTGTVKVGGSTQNANIVVSGAGRVNAVELQADSVSVSMFGAGGVVVNAQKMLSVMMMGSGMVRYRGSPMTNIMRMGTGSIQQIP